MDRLSNPCDKWYQSLEDDVFWVKNIKIIKKDKILLKLIINTMYKLYKIGDIILDQIIANQINSLDIEGYSETSYDDTDWQYPSP